MSSASMYRGKDPVLIPAYSAGRAAALILAPVATVRAWALGQSWQPDRGAYRHIKPVIQIADPRSKSLSFQNLVELHVLSALTHKHKVRLPIVRQAIKYMRDTFGSEHPLAEFTFKTDGYRVFVEHYGRLISASQSGQLVLEKLLEDYLSRVEWKDGHLLRLYPFETKGGHDGKVIAIDPHIQFGRPGIAGRRVTTDVLYDRFMAGEERDSLLEDFGLTDPELDSAFRYETNVRRQNAKLAA